MNYPGKPATENNEPPKQLTYVVDFNKAIEGWETVTADYFSTGDGLITFWCDRDGEPRDHFVTAYPIERIRAIRQDENND